MKYFRVQRGRGYNPAKDVETRVLSRNPCSTKRANDDETIRNSGSFSVCMFRCPAHGAAVRGAGRRSSAAEAYAEDGGMGLLRCEDASGVAGQIGRHPCGSDTHGLASPA